jgi:DNA modification methylase
MTVRILTGDCRDVLATLPAESVHCVVTSPPYWGLRDYGVSGQIGLESTYQGYVEQMVAVFRDVRRVLRADGTLWLNLGDSYASSGKCTPQDITDRYGDYQNGKRHTRWEASNRAPTPQGLKPKDLVGIPWRIAFALQADGWWLRQDIIWSKSNPMPESVTDRCTKAHEYLFLLTKSERYYFDQSAIAELALQPIGDVDTATGRGSQHKQNAKQLGRTSSLGANHGFPTRNKRSVWEVATQPFSEAHFATFPPALIEPCILAGTSAKGCCAKCGAPWVRETERISDGRRGISPSDGSVKALALNEGGAKRRGPGTSFSNDPALRVPGYVSIGWSPSCACNAAVVPCTVLDPFFGAGTTGLVADRLQRDCIGIELNPQYAAMARRRCEGDAPLFFQAAE